MIVMFYFSGSCISLNSTAIFMTQYHNEPAMQMLYCIFNASQFIVSDHIACRTDAKNVAQTLVKNYFRGQTRVRAADDYSKGTLSFFQFPDPVRRFVGIQRMAAHESSISGFKT